MSPVPHQFPDFDRINTAPSPGLTVTWLGHSTCLIELDGKIFLTDPVFVNRPSPLPGMGPKAFPDSDPFQVSDLPSIDAIIISHDHYDHLDYHTIHELASKTDLFFVPLGVAAHLRRWGIQDNRIIELDWWDSHRIVDTGITLTATPAQHFSGRNPFEQNHTLWAGWAIRGREHSVFFGGDSGYGDAFSTIGERLGPFNITMLDSAQYSKYWPLIHMHPEETVRAHKDLRGDVLLPIHWGKFNLSIHPWTEPIERIIVAAGENGNGVVAVDGGGVGGKGVIGVGGEDVIGVGGETREEKEEDEELNENTGAVIRVATPIIGESFSVDGSLPQHPWWRDV